MHKSEQGIASIVITVLLFLGIVLGVFLVGKTQIYKPQAQVVSNDAFESHYNPFGDPWSQKFVSNPYIPVGLTPGCHSYGPKSTATITVPDYEIEFLAKSNSRLLFEECAIIQDKDSFSVATPKERIAYIGQKLKEKNAAIKYLGYYAFLDADTRQAGYNEILKKAEKDPYFERFYVHKKGFPETLANRLLVNNQPVLDITNPNYRQFIIPKVVTSLRNLNLGGFLSDNVDPDFWLDNKEVPNQIKEDWVEGWVALHRDLKIAMGNELLLLIDSNASNLTFINLMISLGRIDGVMFKDPIGPYNISFMPGEANFDRLSKALTLLSQKDKYGLIVTNSNINCNPHIAETLNYCFNQTTKEDQKRLANYYLAAYLTQFLSPKQLLIYYTPVESGSQYFSETFFREWDLKIGNPLSKMEKVSDGVYVRKFENAEVYLNTTNTNYPINKEVSLFDQNGVEISRSIVPAYSGSIFTTKTVLNEWKSYPTNKTTN